MPADRVVDQPLAQLIERDAGGASRIGQEGELGQPGHGVDLEHPRRPFRVDDDVDASHAGASELDEGASSGVRGGCARGFRDAGRDDVVRLARRVFGVVVVDRVLADDLEGRQDLQVWGGEHSDRDLGPRGKPLDQDAAVVSPREDQAAGHRVGVFRDRQADRRTFADRLDYERQAESGHHSLHDVGRDALFDLELFELGHMEPDALHDLCRSRLVHAEGRRKHARAGVCEAEELEHALHRPVLTHSAVQSVEDAVESAIAEDVPRARVKVDRRDVVTSSAQGLGHLFAGAERHVSLRRFPSPQDRELHFQRPTISTSGSICAPKRRSTSVITRSMSFRTSAAVAPPSLTMKLPWSWETTAAPSRAPLSPAAWTRRPAESPGGFLKTLPQFLVLMGCVSLRSRVSFAISCLAWFPSPRSSCRVAETTKAPFNEPSRNADVRYPNCMSAGFHFFRPVPGTKPSTSTRTSRISLPQQPASW